MGPERGIIDASEAAAILPEAPPAAELSHSADAEPAEPADAAAQQPSHKAQDDLPPDPAPPVPAGQPVDLLTRIFTAVQEVAESAGRYHARAEQRERVIDHLHSEVDRLRRGERRGLLRPLLVELCRLRNDLLRQAEGLPDDFDAEQARLLLRSYADSVEIALEDSGVITFTPGEGDSFEPRMHRKVGGEPTSDPAATGRVARVRRTGYLDVDANIPIAPAEVVLFGAASAAPAEIPAARPHAEPDLAHADLRTPDSASATDERKAL